MITVTADPRQYGLSPDELALRLIEQPDWSWDETQMSTVFEEGANDERKES